MAVFGVGHVGLFSDQDRRTDDGHHDDEACKDDGDEQFEDIATAAALVEDPIFAH